MPLLALSQTLRADDRMGILGPVLIANSLNWLLFGLLVVQLNTYYRRTHRDPTAIHTLVGAIFLLDLSHTALLTYHGWWIWVTTESPYGRIKPWDVVDSANTIAFASWLTQLISVLVQLFFASRIWILSSNQIIRTIAVVISFLALDRGFSASAHILEFLGFEIYYSDALSPAAQALSYLEVLPIWSAGGLLPDSLIFFSMVYITTGKPSKSSAKPPTSLLTLAQIGAFPLICTYLDVVLVIYYPAENYHFVPAYILGKMYSNSLVSILTSRSRPWSIPE
ncbi:hypothetical protein C8R46DRAFT_1076728 [Mycena filopes]|nr:hypothetical protein C8R46DRAFT_1076728 [Mycena filopes]